MVCRDQVKPAAAGISVYLSKQRAGSHLLGGAHPGPSYLIKTGVRSQIYRINAGVERTDHTSTNKLFNTLNKST